MSALQSNQSSDSVLARAQSVKPRREGERLFSSPGSCRKSRRCGTDGFCFPIIIRSSQVVSRAWRSMRFRRGVARVILQGLSEFSRGAIAMTLTIEAIDFDRVSWLTRYKPN
jgi:hypothetical protein